MIKVDFKPPNSETWKTWRALADAETDLLIKAIANGGTREILDALYKQCRNEIFAPFHQKCAYCESHILNTNQHGDVEHFRPKKAVKESDGKFVMISDGNGRNKKHPGYYWLAYDWQNLLPSCVLCNQPNAFGGKGNCFPIKPTGKRATCPDDKKEDEHPLLIHPVFDEPAEHLVFDPKTGALGGVTPEGRETIKILGLNRDGLLADRKRTYQNVIMVYAQMALLMIQELLSGVTGSAQILEQQIDDYITGKAPYALAGRAAISDARNRTGQLRSVTNTNK